MNHPKSMFQLSGVHYIGSLKEMQPQNIRAQITGGRKMVMFEKGGLAHAVRLRLSSARLSP